MAHNDPRRRLPPSQIPGHQLYPLLSQLTPLPNLAHIKHENPGGNPGGIPGIHHLATSHHAVVPGKDYYIDGLNAQLGFIYLFLKKYHKGREKKSSIFQKLSSKFTSRSI